ncbi:MAG: hypothetical protein M3R24_21625 [Chloroflexota bacterium]|nr:hypothetical protein [Chloroflexota bacterium]
MDDSATLTQSEVRELVDQWYRKLDVHAPVEELLPLLANDGLEMRFPEATLRGQAEFVRWYEGVTRRFFDEVHELKEVNIATGADRAAVQLIVNWQAHIWNPPAPRSQWLGFDAAQRWEVARSPETQQPIIISYVVDALTAMDGSAAL